MMHEIRDDGYRPHWMSGTIHEDLIWYWNSNDYKKKREEKREVAQRNHMHGHSIQGLGKHTGKSRSFIE